MTSYFCHQCNVPRSNSEVMISNSTVICQTCGFDFLEEITDQNRSEFPVSPSDGAMAAAAEAMLHPLLLPAHRHPGSDLFGPLPGFGMGLNHMINALDNGALDHVMTQLLNQVGAAGLPGPASQRDLARLEGVEISAEQVAEGAQCFVCLDEFKTGDKAEKLPCQHHFHSQCIRPWLDRRGTCPVCRKPLSTDSDEESQQSAAPASASGVSRHIVRANFVIDFDASARNDRGGRSGGGFLEDACD